MKTIFYIGMALYILVCIGSMHTKSQREKKRKERQNMPPLYARYFAGNESEDEDDECPF